MKIMKKQIREISEKYLILRPILWIYFILIGEKRLKSEREKISKEITDLEKSQLVHISDWNSIDGDSTLRVEYDLSDTSVVFDVGGFEGNWSAEIFARYAPKIFIFEPYPPYLLRLTNRFKRNKSIKIIPSGLGGRNEKVLFFGGGDWSSTFERHDIKGSDLNYEVQILNILEFIEDNSISKIDLIKINIEGGEYELLESLINDPIILNVKNLQIQFHNLGFEYQQRMENIQKKLSETH
jgi:FkbM family methyltransferase